MVCFGALAFSKDRNIGIHTGYLSIKPGLGSSAWEVEQKHPYSEVAELR